MELRSELSAFVCLCEELVDKQETVLVGDSFTAVRPAAAGFSELTEDDHMQSGDPWADHLNPMELLGTLSDTYHELEADPGRIQVGVLRSGCLVNLSFSKGTCDLSDSICMTSMQYEFWFWPILAF